MPSYFRLGGEFAVNRAVAYSQTAPTVASFADGGFVTVWGSADPAQDGSSSAIKAQLFDGSGNPVGPEFRVNSAPSGSQFTAQVATLADGRFVVTWVTNGSSDGTDGIKAQLFSRAGEPIGGEFMVNTATAGSHFSPSVAALAGGGFVISWDDWNGFDVKAQLFDPAGARVGGEFRLNTNTAGQEGYGDLAALAGGGFVALWRTTDTSADGSGEAVKGQIFSASGAKVGGEFLVNTVKTGTQGDPSVTALAGGGFVVTWYSAEGSQDVKGQIFDDSGAKVGGEFLVNSQTVDIQREAVVTATSDGGFFVVWTSYNSAQDGSSFAIKAQAFDAFGNKSGGEMLVNTLVSGAQSLPDLATLADGRLIVAWVSATGDGDGNGIRAQILAPNSRPVIVSDGGGTSASIDMDEGGTLVTTVVAADSDGPQPVRYSITGGWAADLFAIDAVTGELFFRTAPDFENPAEGSGNFYTVYVTADDGELSSFQMIQVMVNNVYEDVRFAEPSRSFSIDENVVAVGAVAAAAEPGSTVHYSIAGGLDSADFTIDSVTGAISFRSPPDYEYRSDSDYDNVYHLVVSASDGTTSALQSVAVTVGDVDEPPQIVSNGGADTVSLTLEENGWRVADVVAWEPDVYEGFVYSIAGGADADLFRIDPWTGELGFVYENRPDFERPTDSDRDNVYEVTVRVTHGALSDTQAFVLTVVNVNEGVWITSDGGGSSAALRVDENQSPVTTVTAWDPDGTAPVFQIVGGADASLFAIDARTGVLTFIQAPDFETPRDADGDHVYDVTVAASDGDYATRQDLAVTVRNVDESVDIVSYGGADIVIRHVGENGTPAADVDAVDADGGTVSFAITGGDDSALFAIDSVTGELSFIAAPDFEFPADADGDNVYRVTVTATGGGSSDSQTFGLHVGDVNERVVITSDGGGAAASVSADENQRAVTRVVAEDDDGTFPTFAIVGGADAARFVVDAATGVLQFVEAPDREAPGDSDGDNVYEVVVRASDGSLFDDQALAVAVANVDEGLEIVSYLGQADVALVAAENGTAVGQVAAADEDGDPVTYLIAGGADSALFRVDPVSGALSFAAPPDFERPGDADGDNVYRVEVAAISGAFTATQSFAVRVGDANEALAITSNGGGAGASVAVGENSRDVTRVAAADPEGAAPVYSIAGGADSARFTIDAQTGALQFVAVPDHEAPGDADGDNVYTVIVRASDGTHSDLQTLSVSVVNLRDGNNVVGTTGGDSISSTSTNPQLRTSNAEDTVSGRDGHDTILGHGGDDWLHGDAGNDVLNGGAGADRMTGGLGKDQFVYNMVSDSTPGARDVITDFSRAQGDRISLSGIDANSLVASNQAFTFIGSAAFSGSAGQLRFEQVGGNTLVSGDVDGDRVADFQIELSGLLTAVASDFVL